MFIQEWLYQRGPMASWKLARTINHIYPSDGQDAVYTHVDGRRSRLWRVVNDPVCVLNLLLPSHLDAEVASNLLLKWLGEQAVMDAISTGRLRSNDRLQASSNRHAHPLLTLPAVQHDITSDHTGAQNAS